MLLVQLAVSDTLASSRSVWFQRPNHNSDTPVINRNKDFRKKRGSLSSCVHIRCTSTTTMPPSDINRPGKCGRPASSLIENGHSAIPHKEVDAVGFYKHIEKGMLEPRRMKQLRL
ncbi:hypothetical protein CONLIGDRAFT_685808 [Coniochaeta ligniaria NRRL 30616]|uniref:Uncharacterized protein n=1 Tax=Coniochaeta ligniaria NRRL 30616 TaxID=1408157 RepID=A0A1J7I9Q2_9PEZI|nr:hypothetical protein CONLIGDRAFT_685808 [Coniochaeta ligniaria NRRL 30616]